MNEREEFSPHKQRIAWLLAWNRERSLDDADGKEEDGWEFARGKTRYLILTIGAITNTGPLGCGPIVRY